METQAGTKSSINVIVTVVLSLLWLSVTVLLLAGVSIPLIDTDKSALIVLFAVGFLLCRRSPASLVHPDDSRGRRLVKFLGFIIGVAAIVAILPVFTSIEVPLVTDVRSAFVALTVVLGTKMAVSTGYLLLRRVQLGK